MFSHILVHLCHILYHDQSFLDPWMLHALTSQLVSEMFDCSESNVAKQKQYAVWLADLAQVVSYQPCNTLYLLSPGLCFFIVFNPDLFVNREDSLTSYRIIMRTE